MNRETKQEKIGQLNEKFLKAKAVVLADFTGMTVKETETLRANFREVSVDYQIIKNTFARRASKGTPVENVYDRFTGPVSVALSYDDVVAPAKIISEFNKKNDRKLKVTGGIVEGKAITSDEVEKIANLPSKEVLLGKLLSTMQGPIRGFVGTLNGVTRNFVGLLEAIKEKKEQ